MDFGRVVSTARIAAGCPPFALRTGLRRTYSTAIYYYTKLSGKVKDFFGKRGFFFDMGEKGVCGGRKNFLFFQKKKKKKKSEIL
ncbi:MAG: hypothetical protein FWF05_06305 [Oscillospiraceae bacterium]|nr:hypothetical protein [Oscillospiraceae bacterium]